MVTDSDPAAGHIGSVQPTVRDILARLVRVVEGIEEIGPAQGEELAFPRDPRWSASHSRPSIPLRKPEELDHPAPLVRPVQRYGDSLRENRRREESVARAVVAWGGLSEGERTTRERTVGLGEARHRGCRAENESNCYEHE
jgi:hypothetical protein